MLLNQALKPTIHPPTQQGNTPPTMLITKLSHPHPHLTRPPTQDCSTTQTKPFGKGLARTHTRIAHPPAQHLCRPSIPSTAHRFKRVLEGSSLASSTVSKPVCVGEKGEGFHRVCMSVFVRLRICVLVCMCVSVCVCVCTHARKWKVLHCACLYEREYVWQELHHQPHFRRCITASALVHVCVCVCLHVCM